MLIPPKSAQADNKSVLLVTDKLSVQSQAHNVEHMVSGCLPRHPIIIAPQPLLLQIGHTSPASHIAMVMLNEEDGSVVAHVDLCSRPGTAEMGLSSSVLLARQDILAPAEESR